MKTIILKTFLTVPLIMSGSVFSQQNIPVTDWMMQDSSTVASATGESIASSSYTPSGWYTATVPGTVLSTLVDQKASGFTLDPLIGTNMTQIPDIAKQQKRYWYRATFEVTPAAGQRDPLRHPARRHGDPGAHLGRRQHRVRHHAHRPLIA